jgi:hypothetical protein
MLAREALQTNPNAYAIVRNLLAIPKCEFYDAFRSAQSFFLLFECLVRGYRVKISQSACAIIRLGLIRSYPAGRVGRDVPAFTRA